MCGIVGYIGNKEAYPILIKGLRRLEYRGYDSAGIALYDNDFKVFKKKGKVQDLVDFVGDSDVSSTIGIGHTRWATHGKPNDANAHPHLSNESNLAIIHNGIIENYAILKDALKKDGHVFHSETDTEVLVHLIEQVQQKDNLDLSEAVRVALTQVTGAYAIVVMDKNDPNRLVAARKGSPLVIGIGEGDYYLASDATPIIEYTRNVVYLNDEEIATISIADGLVLKNIEDELQTPYIQKLEMELERLEKGGFDHYMLKEIYEQPTTIADCMRGRLLVDEGIVLSGVNTNKFRFDNAKRIIMAACGTSWHAALIGEYLFEDLARINVEVEYASELRYRNPVISSDDILVALSQSGETADTLAALELFHKKSAFSYGICNVVGSSIARITNAGSYIHAGPEIGVASTKAFTGQVTLLSMMAISLAYNRGKISEARYHELITALDNIPNQITEIVQKNDEIKEIAATMKDAENALYLGRGYNLPIALEGALKLKEISYIHAEGYPAAEMKHGPIALIDENMPVVVIATNKSAYEKIVSNIQEVKARKGKVIAIVNEGDVLMKDIADHVITIPSTEEPLTPLLSVIPLQLLSYHIALMRGCNVDQPRNLAKSVTVE